MSEISTFANTLISRLCDSGLNAKRGFLAQFVDDIPAYPFIALQTGKDLNCKPTDKTVTADRSLLLLIAVSSGAGQDDEMDSALLSVRRSLFKGRRLLHLGDKPTDGRFTIGDAEFFIPEGADHLYVCQLQITIQYTDIL